MTENSDLVYFFNICNLIPTTGSVLPNQVRIEMENRVSMYELTKEIECEDTGRKYHLHIKHYGEFGDTHMVDMHWKYQNPDKHKWELLNVMTVRFNKNKQLYRITNDTYKEKIDNPLRLGLIDWRDNAFSDFEMQRVRMFLDHFIDQIMHCSVNGEAIINCKKESGYTRCVWTIPSLCNPDRKEEAIEKKEEAESMHQFDEISNDNPDEMSDMDLVLTALRFLRIGTERSTEPYEIEEDENGKITQMRVTRTFKNTKGTYKFVGWFHLEEPSVSHYKLGFHWEKKYNAQGDDKFVKLNTYSILFNYATGSIIRVINKIYDAEIDDPMWLCDLSHNGMGIFQVSSFMTCVQRRLLKIAEKKYVTMHTENMASIKNGGVWKQFQYDVYEDNLMETIIAWHDLYQLKTNEPNNIGIFDSVEALKKLKDEVAASYKTHTKEELMEEKDMKKELVDLRVESDINKLIDLITRNEHGEMELAQVREDQDHPEKKHKIAIVIKRNYDENKLIVTYAEFSDKTFDASKPNEITQIIVSFYKGIFTDGGAKDSIEKIKIKTTIQDYKALKQFLADEHNVLHINEIMKFAYTRLSPMKISIEQATYHKMLKKYQGKD